MGTASGTPQRMDDYTAQTNRACGDLASYVRTTLARLISTYRAGAVSFGFDIPGLTSGPSPIDIQVDQLLRRIWSTDYHVRTVGTLLVEAGGPSGPSRLRLPGQLTLPDPTTKPVTTTDAAVDAAEMREGAALAAQMPGKLDTGRAARLHWQTLAQRSGDPLFVTGYFNALSQAQLDAIPWNSASSTAVAAAFASGRLAPSTQRAIAYAIVDRYNNPGEIPAPLFQALSANPQAAANFTRYLLRDRQMLGYVVRANGWGDLYPQFREPHREAPFLRGLLRVFTAAARTLTPAEVKALADAVSGSLPSLDSVDARTIAPQLQQFLAVAIARLVPRPVPKDGEDYGNTLRQWAARYGATLYRALQPYQNWLNKVYADDQASRALLENIVLTVVGTIVTAPIGGEGGLAFAAQAAGDVGWGLASSEAQPWLDSQLHPDSKPPELKNYLHKSAIVAIVAVAYARGVTRDGTPLTLQQLQSNWALKNILARAERGDAPPSGDEAEREEAELERLKLKDGGDLGAAINALRGNYERN